MTIRQQMTDLLTDAFAPSELTVIDESDKHKGHGGWREGGETHFRVRIVAEAFAGKGRVDRHRAINGVLAPCFAAGVHALAIEVRSPNEPDPRAARVSGAV